MELKPNQTKNNWMLRFVNHIERNHTWELIPCQDRQVNYLKWIFKTKYHAKDTLEKHKAQLNSKGYSQNGKSGLTRKHLPQQRGILLLDVAYNLLPTTIVIYSKWMSSLPFWMVAQWKKFKLRSPLVLSFQVHCGLQLASADNNL